MKKDKLITRARLVSGLKVRENEGDAESRVIVGYAIVFNEPSEVLWEDSRGWPVREVIAPEAVSKKFLDKQDIKLTMFHNRELVLGRSKNGEGTLSYTIDDKGVRFECEMPHTADGDKALDLVRRGDISGCSFAFSTYYFDSDCVEPVDSKDSAGDVLLMRVKKIRYIDDFTLALDPAYPQTEVNNRELIELAKQPDDETWKSTVAEMRKDSIFNL